SACAWLCTWLACVVVGVALATLASFGAASLFLDAVAALACVGGGVLALAALSGWRRRKRALRLGEPLPAPRILPVLVVAVALFAVLMVGYVIVQLVTG